AARTGADLDDAAIAHVCVEGGWGGTVGAGGAGHDTLAGSGGDPRRFVDDPGGHAANRITSRIGGWADRTLRSRSKLMSETALGRGSADLKALHRGLVERQAEARLLRPDELPALDGRRLLGTAQA